MGQQHNHRTYRDYDIDMDIQNLRIFSRVDLFQNNRSVWKDDNEPTEYDYNAYLYHQETVVVIAYAKNAEMDDFSVGDEIGGIAKKLGL